MSPPIYMSTSVRRRVTILSALITRLTAFFGLLSCFNPLIERCVIQVFMIFLIITWQKITAIKWTLSIYAYSESPISKLGWGLHHSKLKKCRQALRISEGASLQDRLSPFDHAVECSELWGKLSAHRKSLCRSGLRPSRSNIATSMDYMRQRPISIQCSWIEFSVNCF